MTTAARYADAVPWDLLRQASERGTSVAVVLDRVPAASLDEIRVHLAAMLREQQLEQAPIFTVLESDLEGGLPPPRRPSDCVTGWTRSRETPRPGPRSSGTPSPGALASLDSRATALAAASAAQVKAAEELVDAARMAYEDAVAHVKEGMYDGTLLRGEVLARWQEFVGTGEFFRQVESTVSRVRDRVTAFIKGEPAKAEHLGEALQTGVEALISNRADLAATATARTWRSLPGGDPLLAGTAGLMRSSADLNTRIQRLVRDWQGDILEMVRSEGRDRRTSARNCWPTASTASASSSCSSPLPRRLGSPARRSE